MSKTFLPLSYGTPLNRFSLSAGQKQLIVLARALLKQQKFLIMDEATASIDSETDGKISRLVHEKFTGATVLIIAHRLRVSYPGCLLLPCAPTHQ